MSELIDTTGMCLCMVYELLEEGVPSLRTRIVERLHQSGSTASQTVVRMKRDGLLTVKADRTIKLIPRGARLACDVMRKHRLVEYLLTDVIGLEWERVHAEACRWEHVISDEVERRLLGILESSIRSPYGNPIPGLRDLGLDHGHVPFREEVVPSPEVVPNRGEATVTMERMSENLQADAEVLSALAALGSRPGVESVVRRVEIDLRFCLGDEAATVDEAVMELLFIASYRPLTPQGE